MAKHTHFLGKDVVSYDIRMIRIAYFRMRWERYVLRNLDFDGKREYRAS